MSTKKHEQTDQLQQPDANLNDEPVIDSPEPKQDELQRPQPPPIRVIIEGEKPNKS